MRGWGLLALVLSGCALVDASDRDAFFDQDGDGTAFPDDCDDDDPEINPRADETCDADRIDEDCDGRVNGDDPDVIGDRVYYDDLDGDGYGDGPPTSGCDLPDGVATRDGDCDDDAAAVHPNAAERCDPAATDEDCDGLPDDLDPDGALGAAAWFPDGDGDGFGDRNAAATVACEAAATHVPNDDDCDDATPLVHPGAGEACGGGDEDCDFRTDDKDDDVLDPATWYLDADHDGHGDDSGLPASEALGCEAPAGYVQFADDCDDDDATVSPTSPERCDTGAVDEDCDGDIDDADPSVSDADPWYADDDEDGYGDALDVLLRCVAPLGRVAGAGDCNDAEPAIGPGTAEVCDSRNLDEDCDGLADDADADALGRFTWYADADLDGFGSKVSVAWCDAPPGVAANDTDCDDTAAAAYPGAAEVWCDGLDEACDGGPDSTTEVWYDGVDQDCDNKSDDDQDRDGFDDKGHGGTDCDDLQPGVYPGAVEYMDGIDGNCDGKDWVCGSVTRRVPVDHATIDAAVTAACAGDVILVASGTYSVNLNVSKAITLRGPLSGPTSAPTVRLVPANATLPIVTASRGRFVDLTVADGRATNGGMLVRNASNVRIERVRFENNVALAPGTGGLRLEQAPGTQILDSVFTGNTGDYGGGLYATSADDLVVDGCTFDGNTARVGGGLNFDSSNRATVAGSEFTDNTALDSGGALYLRGGVGMVVTATSVVGNHAGDDGAGLAVFADDVTLRDLDVIGNDAGSGSSGVYCVYDDLLIEDTLFSDNVGDAVVVNAELDATVRRSRFVGNTGMGVSFNTWGAGTDRIEDCEFVDNQDTALGTNGGTLYVDRASFVGNVATEAPAMWIGSDTATLTAITVLDSIAGQYGTAILANGDDLLVHGLDLRQTVGNGLRSFNATLTLDEVMVSGTSEAGLLLNATGATTVAHTTVVGSGVQGINLQSGAPISVSSTILAYNNVGIRGPSTASLTSTLLYQNATTSTGTISTAACTTANPKFVTYGRRLPVALHDLHLAVGSPALPADQGAYSGPVDAWGNAAWYADTDADGMYDGWEADHGLAVGTADAASDLDADGVSNVQELAAGTYPELVDTDGDGKNDGQEKAAATDPLDPTSP